jgi:hypothetical protein
VPQVALEEAVIRGVVDYYRRFTGPDGKQRIEEALGVHAQQDRGELAVKCRRLEARQVKSKSTVAKLLDNITEQNRNHVDRRIAEIEQERREIDREIEALDRTLMTARELKELISESSRFIGCLEPMLREGPMDQRQSALRNCLNSAHVEWEVQQIRLAVYHVPVLAETHRNRPVVKFTASWA